LLDEIEHASFLFFWDEASPETGLVRDKTGVDVCSVASLGFGLVALPVGVERGYVSRKEAEGRAVQALRTLVASNARHEGMFCHFIDLETGNTTTGGYESGASTIDTALLMGGVIVVGEYFGGEAGKLAERLFSAVNWREFMDPKTGQVFMIWTPQKWGEMGGAGEFGTARWDWYSDEGLLIAMLGISAPREEYRLPTDVLTSWKRPRGSLGELEYVYSWPGSLYTYTFSQFYYDFSRLGTDPGGVDWHFNTAMACRANRNWCRSHADEFATYGRDRWGITAGSGPGGTYVVPGHQPRGADGDTPAGGTLHPYGAAMALPHIPDDALRALLHMRALETGGKSLWKDPGDGGYGFFDGFNLDREWVSSEVIGIAQGPMLLSVENARTGLVQDLFMGNRHIREGIRRAGMDDPCPVWPALESDDREYLEELARATWRCIATYVHPDTGLPYDTSEKGDASSVTNLGYYAASCAVAAEMGLIRREEAVRRVRRVLDGYERFEKWKGWSQSWNSVVDCSPAEGDPMVSVLDSANMAAGFLVAGQALAEVRGQVRGIVGSLGWDAVYDAEVGLLWGGYDMVEERLARNWHIGDYAGDGRMAAFLAIAERAAPVESWYRLNRGKETHYELEIYGPGWMGGGLFMQIQDGLFLDERCTPVGRSAANFVYGQMLYAETLDLPVWGWSASWSPDGRYLGWGGLEVDVVTPHAAGMAAMYYPGKAVECLRMLEKMGAREPIVRDGQPVDFGFRDSVNVVTGEVSDLYLPALDQAMLFLAVANLLENGLVQKLFSSDPLARRGMHLIDEYTWPTDQGWLEVLHDRDSGPLPSMETGKSHPPAKPLLVDDFESGEISVNRVGGYASTWTYDPEDTSVEVALSRAVVDRDETGTGSLEIRYDVESPRRAFAGFTIGLAGVDASAFDTLEFRARGNAKNVKVELHGSGGTGITRIDIQNEDWIRVTLPFHRFGGMITDWSKLDRLVFVFEQSPSGPNEGRLLIDDVVFMKRDSEE
jgi:hypothetical protein